MNSLKNVVFLFLFLLFGAAGASAQTGQLSRANKAMHDLDYLTAIRLYNLILEGGDNMEAKINLAECYRKTNDTENAEIWYARIVKTPNVKPVYRLYYGMMLQANGKCEAAKPWLEQYRKENPDDARGQALAKACDKKDELMNKNKDIYVISKMPFNSNVDDFGPAVAGGQLVFASDRDRGTMVKRTNMWTGNPFSELYSLRFNINGSHPGEYAYDIPEKFSNNLNSKFNEAAVSFSTDSKTIYFTRNNYLDGKTGRSEEGLVKLKIYSAMRSETGEWINVEAFPFNSDEYDTAHPSLSADGKQLFFSSNRPGGFGGMDLYVSTREDGRWAPPANLGGLVNSEGNEIFPYIAADNRLYFASNGHTGLGGLDIYYSTAKTGNDQWNLPVNLGFPINSNTDDFGITFSGDQSWGYFTSNREGGVGGDDIYGFKKNAVPMEVYVFDSQTNAPIGGVAVSNNRNDLTMTTGADGIIAFDMRYAECADFSAGKKGYEPAAKNACAATIKTTAITRIEIPMQKQANFALNGIVFDMADGLPAAGASVTIINDCGKALPDAILTGDDGRFQFKLDKNCCYTVRAIMDGYIADVSESQCTKGLTTSQNFRVSLSLEPYRDKEGFITAKSNKDKETGPKYDEIKGLYLNSDGTPASYDLGDGLVVKNGVLFDDGAPNKAIKSDWKRNATGFLINLYYDFNQSNVSESSRPELNRLLRTLKENPDLQIEIAAHTDARGSDDYNLQLSQQRADGVVEWLIKQGIAAERLVGRGYGETQPVNRCVNDVPCSEEEHQLNRRTEFRILGKDGAKISKPKQGIKVAPCEGCPF